MDMSVNDIARRVEQLGPWFHNIRLQGVETAPNHPLGDYPSVKWRSFEYVLAPLVAGRSVLDIGCNGGFYSLELAKLGASRVVAVDEREDYLDQARFAAEISGYEIEFRCMSVYDIADLREQFDIVLFMGVLYHLRHPLLALDLIHDCVAADVLVFQSMLRGSTEGYEPNHDYTFWESAHFDQPSYPKLHFVEHLYANDQTNWWIPNRSCVEAMLRSAGFRIEQVPEEEVYVCRRVGERSC